MPTSFCSITNLALAIWTVFSAWQFSFNVSRGVVRIEVNKYTDDYHIGNDQNVGHFSILCTSQAVSASWTGLKISVIRKIRLGVA